MIVAQPAVAFGDTKMKDSWTTTSWEPEALIDVEKLDRELQSWPGTALTPAERRYYASFATSGEVLHTPWGDEELETGMSAWIKTEYALRLKKHGVRRASAWLWWEARELTKEAYLRAINSSAPKNKGIITPFLSRRGDDSWGRMTPQGDRVL